MLENFRKLSGYGWPNFSKMRLWRQDKGQKNAVRAFLNAVVKKEAAPIPISEILEVSRVAILASKEIRNDSKLESPDYVNSMISIGDSI